jgi:hypothetical protein
MRMAKDWRRYTLVGALLAASMTALVSLPGHQEEHRKRHLRRLQSSSDVTEVVDGMTLSELQTALARLESAQAHAAWLHVLQPTINRLPVALAAAATMPASFPAPTGDTHAGWAMEQAPQRAPVGAGPAKPSSPPPLPLRQALSRTLPPAAAAPAAAAKSPPAPLLAVTATTAPLSAALDPFVPRFSMTTRTATGSLTLSLATDDEAAVAPALQAHAAASPSNPRTSSGSVLAQLVLHSPPPQVAHPAVPALRSVRQDTASPEATARSNILARLGKRRAPGESAPAAASASVLALPAADAPKAGAATADAKKAPQDDCAAMGFAGSAQFGECVARLEVRRCRASF